MSAAKMNRREALERTSLLMGGLLTTSLWTGVLNGCKAPKDQDWTPKFMTAEEARLTERLVDILIPRTDTPGASDALVHRFMDEMLHGYFDPKEQAVIRNGLNKLKEAGFSELSAEKRMDIVLDLSRQEISGDSESFFRIMRSTTLLGYFTSEAGATEALTYDPVPGKYKGCIPLDKYGGKTWAEG